MIEASSSKDAREKWSGSALSQSLTCIGLFFTLKLQHLYFGALCMASFQRDILFSQIEIENALIFSLNKPHEWPRLTWDFPRVGVSLPLLVFPGEFGGIQNVCDGKRGFSQHWWIASFFVHPDSRLKSSKLVISERLRLLGSLIYTSDRRV